MCFASYLADFFFNKINELNLSFQGTETTINNLTIHEFNLRLSKKLTSWSKDISSGCTEMFSCLNEFLTTNEISFSNPIKEVILDHMAESKLFFEKYFPNLNEYQKYNWIRTAFIKS